MKIKGGNQWDLVVETRRNGKKVNLILGFRNQITNEYIHGRNLTDREFGTYLLIAQIREETKKKGSPVSIEVTAS